MKKKYKVMIIVVILLIIAIAAFFIVKNITAEGRKYSIEKVENYNYFVVKQNEKYGVIDKNANIIIEPEFESVKIPNPSKDIFVCTTLDDEKIKIFNEKKEELFTNYDEVDVIKLKNIASDLMYEKSVLKYMKNEKYGLIDFNGKEITKPIYDYIESLEYKEGELLVGQNGKYGVINIKGNNLVPIKYEQVDVDNYYTEENQYKQAGYIVGTKTEEGYRYGYIDVKGNEILKTEYNEISRITDIKDENNIYLIASKNGQYGLNKNKDEILKNEYQSINYDKSNNLIIIEKSKKYGVSSLDGNIIVPIQYMQIDTTGKYLYAKENEEKTIVLDTNGQKTDIDSNISKLSVAEDKYDIVITNTDNETLYGVDDKFGNEIIKPEYTYIEYLFDNYFIVCNKQGDLGVLNDKGEEKIELKYDSVQKIRDTNLIQTSILSENLTQIYSPNIQKICEMKNATISQTDDYIKIYNEQEVKYFSNSGEELDNKQIFKDNKLFAKKESDKWGFVDNNDTVKVECIYDKVTEFNEYGFAGIEKDGKWGVIDSEGKIVLEPKYEFDSKVEPEFLGTFYKVTYGFGEVYYTDK